MAAQSLCPWIDKMLDTREKQEKKQTRWGFLIPDRVYLCPLIYGQIVFIVGYFLRHPSRWYIRQWWYSPPSSRLCRSRYHFPLICFQPPANIIPVVLSSQYHFWSSESKPFTVFPVSVIAPLAAVVLLPAVCGLRVNDDLHKPPQDGGDFGARVAVPWGQSGYLPCQPGCPPAA